MIINNNILHAEEGKVLTNGKIYSTQVILSIYDSINNWQEIDENEIPEEANELVEPNWKQIAEILLGKQY